MEQRWRVLPVPTKTKKEQDLAGLQRLLATVGQSATALPIPRMLWEVGKTIGRAMPFVPQTEPHVDYVSPEILTKMRPEDRQAYEAKRASQLKQLDVWRRFQPQPGVISEVAQLLTPTISQQELEETPPWLAGAMTFPPAAMIGTKGLGISKLARKALRLKAPRIVEPFVGKVGLGTELPTAREQINELKLLHPGATGAEDTAEGLIRNAYLVKQNLQAKAETQVTSKMARLRAMGDPAETLGAKVLPDNHPTLPGATVFTKVTAKSTAPRLPSGEFDMTWHTIVEHWPHYEFTNEVGKAQVRLANELIQGTVIEAEKHGLKYPKRVLSLLGRYIPRFAIGKITEEGFEEAARRGGRATFERQRVREMMGELVADEKIVYKGFAESLETGLRAFYRQIANAEASSILKTLGETVTERMPQETVFQFVSAQSKQLSAQKAVQELSRIAKTGKVTEATLRRMKDLPPHIGADFMAGMKPATAKSKATLLLPEAQGILKETKAAFKGAKQTFEAAKAVVGPHILEAPGERALPQLAGRIFRNEDLKLIERYWGEPSGLWGGLLRGLAPVSRLAVTLKASMDFSAPFIQGWPVMGQDVVNWTQGKPTAKWFRAARHHYMTYFDPLRHQKFLANPEVQAFLKRQEGSPLFLGQSEFYTGLGSIERIMGATVGRVPVVGKPLTRLQKEAYGRASAAFSAFGDAARIMQGMVMEEAWLRNGGTRAELAEVLNMMTGAGRGARMMGHKAGWAAGESGLLFAPSYLRANLLILEDAFARGGILGYEARRLVGGTMAAMTMTYIAISTALGQKPKLDPRPKKYGGDGGNAFTVEIGGTRVGLPGFWYGMMQLVGKITALAMENPNGFLTFRENPLLQRWLSLASPPSSLIKDLTTGRDFVGRRLRGVGDIMGHVAKQLVPIWVEGAFLEEPKVNAFGALGEVMGLRSNPRRSAELRDILRQKLAEQEGVKEWKELTLLRQGQLEDEVPELQSLNNKVDRERSDFWADARADYERRTDIVESQRIISYVQAHNALLAKPGEGDEFRNSIKKTDEAYRKGLEAIRQDPTLKVVFDDFEKWRTDPKRVLDTHSLDILRELYYEKLYAPGLENPVTGEFNFKELDKRQRLFQAEFDKDVWDYIQQFEQFRRKRFPDSYNEWQDGLLKARPYFEIEDQMKAKLDPGLVKEWERFRGLEETDPIKARGLRANSPTIKAILDYLSGWRESYRQSSLQPDKDGWVLDDWLMKFGYINVPLYLRVK